MTLSDLPPKEWFSRHVTGVSQRDREFRKQLEEIEMLAWDDKELEDAHDATLQDRWLDALEKHKIRLVEMKETWDLDTTQMKYKTN